MPVSSPYQVVQFLGSTSEYQTGVQALYADVSTGTRKFTTEINGVRVEREADAIAQFGSKKVAIDAKLVKDTGWSGSISNPLSTGGSLHFGVAEQTRILNQAKIYAREFAFVIYHSNSQELIDYYTDVFRNNNLTNIGFVLTK